MIYNFEWDPQKAKSNKKKHKVSFQQATSVFKDPKALSVFDDKHSVNEERWLTLGISELGILLVVHHTFLQIDEKTAIIRIFSSRKATKSEKHQYMQQNMEKEYDFSKGERGKFLNKEATFNLPVYLEADNLSFLKKIAKRKNSDISTIVNDLIRSDRKIAEIME